MSFKFQIVGAAEIFRNPTGHYHHWTILIGHLLEGTMRLSDSICIPAADGSKMGAYIGGFDGFRTRFGDEVSVGKHSGPFGVMVRCPAPSQEEIARDLATGCSPEEFHELIEYALRDRPERLIHDRGPNGVGLPCQECTQKLYRLGLSVLHTDFESALADLFHHPSPYIAGRARDIISKAISETEYNHQWEQEEASQHASSSPWKFWKHS